MPTLQMEVDHEGEDDDDVIEEEIGVGKESEVDDDEDNEDDKDKDNEDDKDKDNEDNKDKDHASEKDDEDQDEVDGDNSNGEDEDKGNNSDMKALLDPESDMTQSTWSSPSQQQLSSLVGGFSTVRVFSDVNGDAMVCLFLSILPRIHDNILITAKLPPNITNESDAMPSPEMASYIDTCTLATSPKQSGAVLNTAASSTVSKTKMNKGKMWATGAAAWQ
jgi:hypothetical protein